MSNKIKKTYEIVRSFSWKLSLPGYENRDFFASVKSSNIKEKEMEKVSEELYNFVKSEVIKSVNAYLKEIGKQSVNLFLDEKKMKLLTDKEIKKIDDDWQEKYNQASKLAELSQEDKEAQENLKQVYYHPSKGNKVLPIIDLKEK